MTDFRNLIAKSPIIFSRNGLENPFDNTPQSEPEAWHDLKVRECIDVAVNALRQACWLMPGYFLADVEGAKPNYKFALPEIGGINHGLWFYTTDGWLHGRRFTDAMFDANPWLISAASKREADAIARDGLDSVIRFAQVAKANSDTEFAKFGGLDLAGGIRGPLN